MRLDLIAAVVLLCFRPIAGHATSADSICPAAADPCDITTRIDATPGSVIDVGERELRIVGAGSIVIQEGSLTLRAARLSAGASALIRTSGRTRADPAANLRIEVSDLFYSGEIDARGSPGGNIIVVSTGPVSISGQIRARSESGDANGGTVEIRGGDVDISATIDASGGRDDTGGDVSVAGEFVVLSSSINVAGGDGGTVDISADDTLELTDEVSITADATLAAGDGGDISIASDNLAIVRGSISSRGRTGGDEGGGDGGAIAITGDNSLIVPSRDASIDARGGSPDGLGGDIELSSLFGTLIVRTPVDASSIDRDGLGGSIDLSSDGAMEIDTEIDVRGALGGGGDVEIDSLGSLLVTATSVIDASSTREAQAGTIRIIVATVLTMDGRALAQSSQQGTGVGGSISFDACSVSIRASAELDARGPQGSNLVAAGGGITVRGRMFAGPIGGVNEIQFPVGGPTPILTGSSIQPSATQRENPMIPSCLPPTATPVATATPTASNTPTPTRGTLCPGDCNGDGDVSISELVRAVNIALGAAAAETCRAADVNGDGRVAINELVAAVGTALTGCP